MCLEKKKYDQNINVPNNYARTVRCAHVTQMRVIAKSKVNCERSFKCYFNTHILIARKLYTILECCRSGTHALREWAVMVKKLRGSVLKKTVLRRALGCASTHTLIFFFALQHTISTSLMPFPSVFDSAYGQFLK